MSTQYRISCEVSGGVTGYRQSYLKENDQEWHGIESEAITKAEELNSVMNAGRRSDSCRAMYYYCPEECFVSF